MESLTLFGYFPKRVVKRPDWLKVGHITAIRSVSECISRGPEDWINRWKHNEMWRYSTLAAARSVIPENERDQFEIHGYRILPVLFDNGHEKAFEFPPLLVEPLPAEYRSIGFDAVERNCGNTFDCSPLSCNSLAETIQTNEHCLLEDLQTARHVAHRFSIDEPEPGPYCVLEVLCSPGEMVS